jgi:hypothetical protein
MEGFICRKKSYMSNIDATKSESDDNLVSRRVGEETDDYRVNQHA